MPMRFDTGTDYEEKVDDVTTDDSALLEKAEALDAQKEVVGEKELEEQQKAQEKLDAEFELRGKSFDGSGRAYSEREVEEKIGEAGIGWGGGISRGKNYEQLKDAQIDRKDPKNFPVIDDNADNIAKSMKTMDLNAKSYNSEKGVEYKVNSYVNKLDSFERDYADPETGRVQYADRVVLVDEIEGKELHVGVPLDSVTEEQERGFENARSKAEERGIRLVIDEIP